MRPVAPDLSPPSLSNSSYECDACYMMWLSHDGKVSGSRGRHERQYFGRHGMYVRIGYRLSSLDMGTCARICRLGGILGRGAGTSTIRVNVFRVFRVRHTTHAVKMHYYDSIDAG